MKSVESLMSFGWVIPIILFFVFYKFTFRLFGVVIVPENCIAVLTKKFVLLGKNKTLPDGKIIALNGEAGIQADTLAPGIHFFLWPWQYVVELKNFTIIPPGKIGVVESCDGKPLPDGRILGREVQCDNFQDARAFLIGGGERGPQMGLISPGTWRINPHVFTVKIAEMTIVTPGKVGVVEARDGKALSGGRVLGKHVECDSFQNAMQFLESGGERGPQMRIVPQGQYRINPMMFVVTLEDVTDIPDNMVGVVTTKEGKPLATGEIAGKEVAGHDSFQNPQAFVDNGGFKGLQEEVLRAGRYFMNPRFVTIEQFEMTKVPIANVGVVIAYVGAEGHDVTGTGFKHGNLVSKGEKGVWVNPLDPGKYPINPHTHKVELVPTANVVLNWADGKTEAHKLDANLSTIKVRSSDGFTFNLDVSQIIHIPSTDAPKVIARFGSVGNLVTQVLEPMIANYFRNAAQTSDVIDFLKNRSTRQSEAKDAIQEALAECNVGAVDTLIGDIAPPDALMKTLTDRKIAEQEKVTFDTQRLAEETRKELEQAKAIANTQAKVVDSERKVAIAQFDAEAAVNKADGEGKARVINAKAEAESRLVNAEAEAKATIVTGDADGQKILAKGNAEAEVIQKKTNAVGAGNFALIEIGKALAESKIKLMPDILVTGGGGAAGGGGNLVDVLLAQFIAKGKTEVPKAPEVKPAA